MLQLFFQKVYAQGQTINVGIPTIGGTCNAGQQVDLPTYIGCIYAFAIYIAVGLATLMLIWAGYNYMNSQGNPDAIAVAKDMIWGTLAGLLLLALGYLILQSIGGGIV